MVFAVSGVLINEMKHSRLLLVLLSTFETIIMIE
jgi:hypothetical protein